MKPIALSLLLLFALLAGCSQDVPPTSSAPVVFEEAVQATQEGRAVLLGYVLDDALRPVVGAQVTVRGAATNTSVSSGAEGAFAVANLVPGTYTLRVTKEGFHSLVTTAEAVAGTDPRPVLVRLTAIPEDQRPYVVPFHFAGFIQCQAWIGTAPLAPCTVAGQLTGNPAFGESYYVLHEFGRTEARRVQVEASWKSNQQLGSDLTMRAATCRFEPEFGVLGCPANATAVKVGTSPLVAAWGNDGRLLDDPTIGLATREVVGVTASLEPAGMGATRLSEPACLDDNRCYRGVGFAFEQRFDLYTHAFYNYEPPTTWTFVADGAYPPT